MPKYTFRTATIILDLTRSVRQKENSAAQKLPKPALYYSISPKSFWTGRTSVINSSLSILLFFVGF